MKTKILFTLLFLTQFQEGLFAQWMISYSHRYDSIVYRPQLCDIEIGEQVEMTIPSTNLWEDFDYRFSIKATWYNVSGLTEFENKYLNIELKTSLQLPNSPLKEGIDQFFGLSFSIYQNNIDNIFIYIKDERGVWNLIERKKIHINLPFQHDINVVISKSLNYNLPSVINGIKIVGTKMNPHETSNLTIGNLKVKKINHILTSVHVESKYCNTDFIPWDDYLHSDKTWLYAQPPIYSGHFSRILKLEVPYKDYDFNDSLTYISTFVHTILEQYRHYDIKPVCKHKILNKHLSIIDESISLDQYYTQLNKLLTEFNDIHFRLFSQEERNIIYPLYFSHINDNYELSAVFDSILYKNTMLGDEIVKINDINISDLENVFSNRIYATSESQRKHKLASRLMDFSYQYFNDTLELSMIRKDNTEYILKIDSSLIYRNYAAFVPSNFVANTSYRRIDDLAYVRIRKFIPDLIPFWNSHVKDIIESKGLIIDLRDNPGGDFTSFYLTQFFINDTETIAEIPIEPTNCLVSTNNFGYFRVKVNPSDKFHYFGPIVILFNERTSCASEIFISALKKYNENVITMAASKTAGGMQLLYEINLPSYSEPYSLWFYLNSTLDANGNNIDALGGISPDIKVDINSYIDTQPYNDVLLHEAIQYLQDYQHKRDY